MRISKSPIEWESRTVTRAEPLTARVERVIDQFEARLCRERPEVVAHRVKADMARQLADFILENCHLFEVPEYLAEGDVVRFEVTINDRGTYEHMLPRAKDEGERIGRMETLNSLPYGTRPDEFYE